MFVAASDFDLHPYMIPSLGKIPSFQDWVDQEEERYLKEVLGYDLYTAFVGGLPQEYSPTVETVIGELYAYGNNVWEALVATTGVTPVEGVNWTLDEENNRWLLLKNGGRYLLNGKYYDYVGIKETVKPLIYSLWVENGAIQLTANGFVVPNSENSSKANPGQKICNSWNEWARYVGSECEQYDTLYGYLYGKRDDFEDVPDPTFSDFTNYLVYEFTPQERKNAFGI